MLMLKLIKKAMIASVRDQFEDSSKMPRETHMVNINLLKKLAEKFIYGHKRRKFTQKKHNIQTFKNNLKLLAHYLKFPTSIEHNSLFAENKFKPSTFPSVK